MPDAWARDDSKTTHRWRDGAVNTHLLWLVSSGISCCRVMSRASKEKQQWDKKRNMGSVGMIDGSANLETALSSPAAMLSGTTFNLVLDAHGTHVGVTFRKMLPGQWNYGDNSKCKTIQGKKWSKLKALTRYLQMPFCTMSKQWDLEPRDSRQWQTSYG